jgi:hypothetical protein
MIGAMIGGKVLEIVGEPLTEVLKRLLSTATRNDFVHVVSNGTRHSMRRSETFNDSDHWPFDDVPAGTTVTLLLERKNFSFASKYALGESGRVVILAGSSPFLGAEKIDVEPSGSRFSCKDVWERMDDGHDKGDAQVRAYIKSGKAPGSRFWVWDIGP